jgi:hypothetical protein
MFFARFASVALLLAAMIAAGAWLLERQKTAVLRDQIALLREDERELGRLAADNARLKAQLPTEAELSALRADRAAATKLRSELNALQEKITRAEQTQQVREAAARP